MTTEEKSLTTVAWTSFPIGSGYRCTIKLDQAANNPQPPSALVPAFFQIFGEAIAKLRFAAAKLEE